MPKSPKPGDALTIWVGGVKYPGVVDERGTYRFVRNEVIDFITREGGPVSLNDLCTSARRAKFPIRHLAEFWMMLGYSFSGFADLSFFESLEIVSPTFWREGTNYDGTTGARTPWTAESGAEQAPMSDVPRDPYAKLKEEMTRYVAVPRKEDEFTSRVGLHVLCGVYKGKKRAARITARKAR